MPNPSGPKQTLFEHLAVIARALGAAPRLELLEVLGGVGDREPGDPGQVLDAALALGEEVE